MPQVFHMAPSTSGKTSCMPRTAKNKTPASLATSTSVGGRKNQKNTATTEATKVPSKHGRKTTTLTGPGATDIDISAKELATFYAISACLTAANKAQKEASNLGAVFLYL
jgi:hypothetical protein